MPHLRILFDITQAGDPVPARAFFRSLVSALDAQMLAGCSLYHGFADQPGSYCIVIHSDDAAALGMLARSAMSANWGFATPPGVVIDQAPLRTDRLALAAKVSPQGYLEDIRFEALAEIWRNARPEYQHYQNVPPPAPQHFYPREAPQPMREPPPPPPQPAWGGGYGQPAAQTVPLPRDAYEPPPMAARYPALRRHPQFPKSTPPVLEASASRDRAAAAIGGILAGVLLSFAIFSLAPRSTQLFQMFDLRKVSTVIPVAVLAMFFWGCGICLLRWRRLGAMEAISGRDLLLEAIPLLDNLGLHGLHADLEDEVVKVSPLLRRMKAAVHQWSLHPSLQDTDVILQQLAASDDEAIHAGYSLARTFVWALPVLGLIGTVIGIAGAVGGFAQFLGGSIDDINIIKQNLVNVTGGLSFAFLITLEGLLTSLLLMLAASSLQTRERELYARVQEDIADQLVPALQRVAPEGYKTQGKQSTDLSGVREMLAEYVSASSAQMTSVCERLLSSFEIKHSEWMTQLSSAGDRLLSGFETKHADWMTKLSSVSAGIVNATRETDRKIWQNAQDRMAVVASQISTGMETAASQVTAGMSRSNDTFLESLRTTFHDFSAQQSAMATAASVRHQEAERYASASAVQQQALMQKLIEQAESARAAAAAVTALSETTERVLQCQQEMRQALRDLDGGPTRAAFDGFAHALGASSAEMAKVMQSAENLGRLTNQIITSQAALQQATQQLADSQFTATMSDFRKSMVSLAPVLASFQKPFVLQAVPFARDGVE